MTQVPKVLLDEVLGPLPEMPEREWLHYTRHSIPPGKVGYCGAPLAGEVIDTKPRAEILANPTTQDCPDCLRVMRGRR